MNRNFQDLNAKRKKIGGGGKKKKKQNRTSKNYGTTTKGITFV